MYDEMAAKSAAAKAKRRNIGGENRLMLRYELYGSSVALAYLAAGWLCGSWQAMAINGGESAKK